MERPKKEKLHDLASKMPRGLTDESEFMAEVRDGSDRASALVSFAHVDRTLTYLLRSYLKVPLTSAEETLLLTGPTAILGSANARSATCYAFGFINDLERDDLARLRRVRNVFAHAATTISFSHEPIAAECRALLAGRKELEGEDFDARRSYGMGCFTLARDFSIKAKRVSRNTLRATDRKLASLRTRKAELDGKIAEIDSRLEELREERVVLESELGLGQ